MSDLTSNTFGDLSGLPLLPLSDGSVGVVPYGHHIFMEKYIVATIDQQLLLPRMASRFLSLDFTHSMSKSLQDPKFVAALGAQMFSVQFLSEALDNQLPKSWKHQNIIRWDEEVIDGLWMVRFWKEVLPSQVSMFHSWPLLPLYSSKELMSCRHIDRIICLWKCVPLAHELQTLLQQANRAENDRLVALERESCIIEGRAKQQLEFYLEDNFDNEEKINDDNELAEDTCPENINVDIGPSIVENNKSANDTIFHVLVKIQAPLLELAYFSHAEDMIFSVEDTHIGILGCLDKCLDRLDWHLLSSNEKNDMVQFFSRRGSMYRGYNRNQIDQIRKLPIFPTITDAFVSLSESTYYILGDDIASFPNFLSDSAKSSFIRVDAPILVSFYKELNVEVLSEAQLLMQFVIPQFQSATGSAERHEILDMIKRKWSSVHDKVELISFLKQTPLFPCARGGYICASMFMDPRNSLLRAIFAESPEYFPQPPYSSDDWLDILTSIGMPTDVSMETFLLCATHVSKFSSPLSLNNEEVVMLLHEYFISHVEQFEKSRVFVQQLKAIAFVPATQFNLTERQTTLVRYSDGAVPADQLLVCLAKPIIQSYAVPPRILWSRFDLISPPTVTDVMEHIVKIARHSNLVENWTFSFSITDMFLDIFDFLHSHWRELNENTVTLLRDVPLIPVGASLVKANRLYFRLKDNLAPFLFEVPRVFGAYDELFRRLGTKDAPHSLDYVNLLRELQTECPSLNLNEMRGVVKVLELLETSDPNLAIPTTDNKLSSLDTCVYNDAPWIMQEIDTHRVVVAHPSLSGSLCLRLQIPKLTTVVREVLAPTFVDEICLDATKLTQRLQSQVFINGLQQIIECQSPGETTDVSLWSKFTIRCVRDIPTRFFLSNGIDITRSGTQSRLFYVDSEAKVLFVAPRDSISLVHAVVLGVQHKMRGLIKDSLPVLALLEAHSVSDTLLLLRLEPERNTENSRGQPGQLVNEYDKSLLELKPLRSFLSEEIVAIEKLNDYIYATVRQEQIQHPSGTKQVEVCVDVDTNSTLWLPSTQVFSFQSLRHASNSQTSLPSSHLVQEASVVEISSPTTESMPTVSQHTIVDAVNDLLRRVNMNLSEPYESLVNEVVQLRQRLARAEEGYAAMTARVDVVQKEKKELIEGFVCSICLEKDVNRVLIPCGHIFCNTCIEQLPRKKCPVCRQDFTIYSAFHKPI
ncbi:hypothetical protein LEN26_012555 [Aphanomyces euteiches]|nr:hypothetical protein LEN26_012555 [Aphanomyces euteiches]